MKAILDINGFTKMIDIPEQKPEWYVIAPMNVSVNVMDQPFGTASMDATSRRWGFRFKDTIYSDAGNHDSAILSYVFDGEI